MSGTVEEGGFVSQGQNIVDYVFSICDVEVGEDHWKVTRFLGTGFFIGSRGHALTAAHVLDTATSPVILMTTEGRRWQPFAVQEAEDHPTEDVAVLRIEPLPGEAQWRSIFALPDSWVGSALPYFLFGYPESAMREVVRNDMALYRPDLIYSEGHVRRRLSNVPVPKVRGSLFLELSQVAGAGCSGSPVVRKPGPLDPPNDWRLIGVYAGERLDGYSTSVGYAVRLNELREWVPKLIHKPLSTEINPSAT